MKTKLFYQDDSYIKEFDAVVLQIEGNEVVLDKTAFHDGTGGVQADSGYLKYRDRAYETYAAHRGDEVVHVLKEAPVFKVGDVVIGVLDWDKRYRKMRLHTAAHIISALLYNRHNALVTGGEITHEYARDDFNVEGDMGTVRKIFEEAVAEANEIVQKGLEVRVYWLPREEALRIPGVVKLAERMPPDAPKLRIVEIPGVDVQADGGPHVKNTGEIGKIRMLKVENRGKNKKRLYYTVD